VPRVRAAWTRVHVARRVLAYPNRRRVSQPPGLCKPSAFPRVSQRPPLRRHPCWSPLPRALTRFGPTPPSAALVPPSPFLPASTVSSTNRFAGLLRPASDPEVHRVSAHRRRMPATASALPHRRLPSRAFPFRGAAPASPRGPAPLSFSGNTGATSRPCSARKSVAATARGRTALLDALLGFPTWSPSGPRSLSHPANEVRGAPQTCASAGRSAGSIRASCATAARRPRPRRVRGGGIGGRRHRRATPPSDPTVCAAAGAASSPVCHTHGTSPKGSGPRRPASPSDARQRDGPEGARTAAASEVSMAPSRRVGTTAEAADPVCSPACREVGGRRRRGPRCRWVDQVSVCRPGSGDQREAPAPAWGREVPPTSRPQGSAWFAAGSHRCDTGAVPGVGGDVLQVLVRTSKNDPRIAPSVRRPCWPA
jgi:hypothetical protein